MSNENDKPEGADAEDSQAHVEAVVLPEDTTEVVTGDEDLATALEKARAEAEENWSKYLRSVAELENVRKRSARELEKARNFGVEGLAGELLSVADSLEMALETGATASADTLLEGGRATLKQLQTAMEKHGITEIFPEGEPFDPEMHEAMTTQLSDTAEPDTVIAVVQRGYQLNGRLLRAARVIVAREPE